LTKLQEEVIRLNEELRLRVDQFNTLKSDMVHLENKVLAQNETIEHLKNEKTMVSNFVTILTPLIRSCWKCKREWTKYSNWNNRLQYQIQKHRLQPLQCQQLHPPRPTKELHLQSLPHICTFGLKCNMI
jgi:hypothetical protein